MGLAMLMHGIAWLLNDLFFEDNVWIGFMIEALFWFLVAGRRRAASPTARCRPALRRRPDLAIEEAEAHARRPSRPASGR